MEQFEKILTLRRLPGFNGDSSSLWVSAVVLFTAVVISLISGCGGGGATDHNPAPVGSYSLALETARLTTSTPNPFQVIVTLKHNGLPLSGQNLRLAVPNGTASAISDLGNGQYRFTVTPASHGPHPVTISFNGAMISRTALVMNTLGAGVGQPMLIPGNFLNTDGYEDGVTITPDGQYLFVQYGPFHFSGLVSVNTICASGTYSIGYDLNTCNGRPNSSLVFRTVGPYNNPLRPNFPTAGITSNNTLKHLPSIVIGGVANGLVGFPTVFYGFKRQADGSFAEPFKVAFNDERGLNGPFGLSFKPNPNGTTDFVMAWNNFFNDLGDDKPDIYSGTLKLGEDHNLGDVVYAGEAYASITPRVAPVNFSSHTGTQGNPYLELNASGEVKAVWTDDETSTHDLSVYRLISGTFPTGTWVRDTLPAVINTAGEESQPTMIGHRLYMNRNLRIVYHEYRPTNGSCASTYTHADCWGPEVTLVQGNGSTAVGEMFGVGEPSIANVNGKKYLYFVFVTARANAIAAGVPDFNLDPAFVEIP